MQTNELLTKIEQNISKVIIGKREVTRLLLASLAAGGHVLLEDVPGTGKTILAKSLAKSMGCKFERVQFTPDLLPSDVTGLSFFNQEKGAFTFKEGPVFTNILLADEINRATPRTQSSLLECMAEGQVTVDAETRLLEPPFFVIATQNPVETIGCFPLPEAQLDRFMFKILVRFPSKEELRGIVGLTEGAQPPAIEKQIDGEGLLAAQALVSQIPIADAVMDYLLELVMATHAQNPYIREGASPRAAQALIRAARAKAFLEGRFNVSFQDVQEAAYPVLRHRIIPSFDAVSAGVSEDDIIKQILDTNKNT